MIKNILQYTIMPPIKMIIFVLILIPAIWLIFAGDEDRANDLMDSVIDYEL